METAMRRMLPSLCLAALVSLAPAGIVGAEAGEEISHAVFARVNGKAITQAEMRAIIDWLLLEYQGVPPPPSEQTRIHHTALRMLIFAELVLQEAKRENVKVPREPIEDYIKGLGVPPRLITPALRRIAEADHLFDGLLHKAGTPPPPPTPDEIRKYKSRNLDMFRPMVFIQVQHIFLYAGNPDTAQAKMAEARQFRTELLALPAGEPRKQQFEAIAKEFSQDAFAKSGGFLPAFDRYKGEYSHTFEQADPLNDHEGNPLCGAEVMAAIRNLRVEGEIPQPFASPLGIHLIHVPLLRVTELDDKTIQQRIVAILTSEKREAAVEKWMRRVLRNSSVRYHDGSPVEVDILFPPKDGR